MKLTTKRNRWYFWRELFSYMIPIILIVGTVDVFYNFMRCPLHPEWSAPCSINWILAAMYGVFLILVIILTVVSARKLRKVKNQIENEFTETIDNHMKEQEKEQEKNPEESTPKKIIVKENKESENKNNSKKIVFKKTTSKKSTIKKSTAKE